MLAIEKEVYILARNQYNDGFKISKMASGKRQDRPSIIKECVNESLMESGQTDSPFFSLQRSKFVDAVYALANPVMGRTKTEVNDVERYEKHKARMREYRKKRYNIYQRFKSH